MLVTEDRYQEIKENKVSGRYITNYHLNFFLKDIGRKVNLLASATSVLKSTINHISLGKGPNKVLMWSQMHGNESTTTKAVLDIINFLNTDDPAAMEILSRCTIRIIPILNPDGARAYTRENANGIDLNRDAIDLSQPESQFLREVFDEFQPHFCFNLHDQRTIFNVGDTGLPATVSFLAPAYDPERNTSPSRALSKKLIVLMNKRLQELIPGRVGRYDDTFNPNCVGDAFQMLGVPTVLFEAGHTAGDYQREFTRMYIFFALLEALYAIGASKLTSQTVKAYEEIPQNNKLFFDILVHNPRIINAKFKIGESAGLLYREVLKDDKIVFDAYLEHRGDLDHHFGHQVYDCAQPEELERLKNNSDVYVFLTQV